MQKPSLNKGANDAWLVSALWLFFQILWFMRFGFHFDLEAPKYIAEADFLTAHHHLSQFRYVFYFPVIGIIILSRAVHIGLAGALFVIMAFNLCSYLFFYAALKKFFSNWLSPLLVIMVLLSFWPYQSWSLFLFTECFFYSAVLLLFSRLLLYQNLSRRFLFSTFALTALVIISRPLGILFVLPVLLFIFFKLSKKQRRWFYGAAVLFFILFNFVVQVVFTTTEDWNMMKALTEDSIICDMPRHTDARRLFLSHSSNQLYQLFYYVTHNFSRFGGLAFVRLRYFFTLVRPYYSFGHNAYLVAYLIILYGSLILNFRRISKAISTSLVAFIISVVLLFAAAIALQCDDYHNRFFLTLMPLLVFMAVAGWQPYIQRWSLSKQSRRLPESVK